VVRGFFRLAAMPSMPRSRISRSTVHRVRAVSVSQHQCPVGPDGGGPAVVNVGGGVQAEAAVAVLVVVPGEEVLAVRSCCLDRVEAAGEARPVLEGLELAFRERVVVALTG
jgi:hypothetical protein